MALTKVIRPLIDSNTLIEITSAITPKVYITNIFYTDQNYANTNFGSVDYSTGGYVKILGRGFQNNANVFVDTDEVSSYYVNLNEYRIQVPPKANGDYDLSIYNRNGRNVKKLQAIKYTDGPITIPGTYTLTAIPGISINEGNTLTIRLDTTLVPQQTVIPYVISGVSSADINGESLFGDLIVQNNEAVKELIISADVILEGNETLTFSLPTITGTPSVNVTINDTSFPIPTYNFVGLPFSVDEGSIQYINVATSNVATSTTLYWTLSHLTTDGDDFTNNFGSFEITSNTGSFFIETIDDLASEGNQTFRIQLRTGSITGNLVRTSNTITINDTSLQPFYSVSQNTTNVNEGQSVLFEIDTINVLNGTTLYWTINSVSAGVTTNDFITPSNGSITMFGGVNTVLITANTDANTEGSELFNLQLRTDSISGNIVANSSTITILDTSKDPSYIITPNVSSFNENSSVLFTVTTTDVKENDVLYWTLEGVTGNVDANDFITPNSGSITIPSNGISTILLSANTDANTEGNEIFKLQLRTDSLTGNVVNTSANITLVDSSQNPNYIITPNTSIVDEGNTVVFTITTTDVTDGTTVYYTTESITANLNSDDFTTANTGSITITSGIAEVALTINADLSSSVESDEIFRLQLRSGSISGDVINVSSNVTISDTSNVETYSVTANVTTVVEGQTVLFTVQTTSVPDGTVLYWTTESLGGEVNSSDFSSPNSGTVTIVSSIGTFQTTLFVDGVEEVGDLFRVQLRTGSISGPVVNTSQVISITDSGTLLFTVSSGPTSCTQVFSTNTTTSITTEGVYTLTVSNTTTVIGKAWGAAGGGNRAGQGGFTKGVLTLDAGTTYRLVVGRGGMGKRNISPGDPSGNGAGGLCGYTNSGVDGDVVGSGGGYTGLFRTSTISQANALLIAGGGGGGGGQGDIGFGAGGGQGGGLTGGTGSIAGNGGAGSGGTQSAGGARGENPVVPSYNTGSSGSALTGGSGALNTTTNYTGGGGGGGWYGGGGGGGNNWNGGTGGGGSGYFNPTYVSSGVTSGAYQKTSTNPALPPGTIEEGYTGSRGQRIYSGIDQRNPAGLFVFELYDTEKITAGPPIYGYFVGGYLDISRVDRITFASDTVSASARGPLDQGKWLMNSAKTNDDGWFAGGNNSNGDLTSVSRITFATDTNTASARGNLTNQRRSVGGVHNLKYGWVGGISQIVGYSSIERIEFLSDSVTASIRGNFVVARNESSSFSASNYGWFLGGLTTTTISGTTLSSIERISYNSDTINLSTRGILSTQRRTLGAFHDYSSYGWVAGGYSNSTFPQNALSNIERVTFASDTSTASTRGNLNISRGGLNKGSSNFTYGWVGGGSSPSTPANYSSVERITFASDTSTASTRGSLNYSSIATGATI